MGIYKKHPVQKIPPILHSPHFAMQFKIQNQNQKIFIYHNLQIVILMHILVDWYHYNAVSLKLT